MMVGKPFRVGVLALALSFASALSLAAGAALADPAPASSLRAISAQSKPPSPIIGDHACMCRARGVAYEVGERICIGDRMAECTVEINVMNWRLTTETCPHV